MFEPLREAIRQAVENFRTELHAGEGSPEAEEARRALDREFSRAQRRLDRLSIDLREALAEERAELDRAEACHRREGLAQGIEDEETSRLAREFRERHLRRAEILGEKARVLSMELEDRRVEVEGMRRRSRELLSGSVTSPGVAEAGTGE